mgnify:CR=1 FL=1
MIHNTVEDVINKFAKKRNMKVFGSFDPTKLRIDNSGFYDGMHSKEKTIQKILKVRTHNNVYKSLVEW